MQATYLKRSAVALAIALALGAGYIAGERHIDCPVVTPAQAAMMPSEAAAKTGVPDFSGLAETYGPAVVNISAKHVVTSSARARLWPFMPTDPDDPFYQFFRHFYGDPQPPRDAPSASLGSGFIVSQDGYILTNAHVVDDANIVTVKLTDKREYRAKVVGIDKPSDVALLKIDAHDLPTVKIGDPSKSKAGQWVVAIGSPYGFTDTVTSGIISAKSRSLPDDTYVPFIQTDVPVNPGNSGGPLFNLDGEVIGINSVIYSQTGGFQGLSFAIPIDVAMKVKDDLIQHGHVSRGRIGVTIQEMNQTLAKSFGLATPRGALVAQVDSGGPADKAGVKAGDVILAVGGREVKDSSDVPVQVSAVHPGDKIVLQVWRNGVKRDLSVTVGSMKDTQLASLSGDPGAARLGVMVRALTPEEKREAAVGSGLVVEQASGAASAAGIQPGDVILAINGKPVATPEQLRNSVAHAGNSIALLIERGNTQIFVPVEWG